MADPSIERFRKVVASACAQLEARRQEVNDLNVFPVADGDTGDNMVQTLRSVMSELNRLNGQMVDEIGRDEIVQAVARGDRQERFREGDAVGFIGDEIVAWGEPDQTLGEVLTRLGSGTEVVTCIGGDGAPLGEDEIAAIRQEAAPHVEVEYLEGGQAHYWWLLAAE